MRIPNKIELMNSTIFVEYSSKLLEDKNQIAFADYKNNRIIIDTSPSSVKFQEEAFFHELTHWILFKMGSKLEANEHFVGLFGDLLHQAFKTAEY